MIDCVCHACGKHYSVNAPGKYLCTCGEMFSCESAGEVKKTDILTKNYHQSKSKETKPVAIVKEVPKETVCPFCMSAVPAGAKKCAHCGEWINGKPKSKLIYILLWMFIPTALLGAPDFYIKRQWKGTVICILSLLLTVLCIRAVNHVETNEFESCIASYTPMYIVFLLFMFLEGLWRFDKYKFPSSSNT